jgi:hypothetical protein
MKKLVLFAFLPIIFIACNRDETIVNDPFRTPTCQDTTDDGVFEEFNSPETASFLKYYEDVPTSRDTSAIRYTFMSSNVLLNYGFEYEPYFVYNQKKHLDLRVYLAYGNNQFYTWHSVSPWVDSPIHVAIYNARLLKLAPGCYRAYYVLADTAFGKVVDKGHYDISIVN